MINRANISDMARTHVTHMFCRSAGMTAFCDTCRHNPMNQIGLAKGREITPACRAGKCPHYVKQITRKGWKP